ncbi:MAG: gluconate 2-dehydrogenase subunit 3 family protein [Pseudomonadales bacterium]|jgi:gluconate 2-dehydrogenase gamma chain|nr:gluconate 2-dehydrogenase subunit 3 family protein [Pseudomonadales bacterium]|tara:strand:- start:82 stop:600 length:519 start_codon:yes stop_codon:yes gene_type:complete
MDSPDKPHAGDWFEDGVFTHRPMTRFQFPQAQSSLLEAVQSHLFPDDGNGPCARDLNALAYLELAMDDPVNAKDDDPDFLLRGCKWLDEQAQKQHVLAFVDLERDAQQAVMEQIARLKFGRNWLSLLMYYLTEALMLDPVYGGNPDMVGWLWLEHRPGFPRPLAGKTHREFE